MNKISFCIVCMNRLYQLRETLLQNIKDNEDYEELEFVVLDYNSQDEMESWIKENMGKYIASGKMIYYRTDEPKSFSHSHAKNLCFKLATGDIVCNINADHYTGYGFASYINRKFNENNGIALTPIDFPKTRNNYHPPKDVLGRVCVRKSDFLRIKGFDEHIGSYGFEDYDFINRLEMAHVKRVLIEDFSFLNYIAHDDEERYSLKTSLDNIFSLFVYYCTPSVSEFILLYNDQKFEKGTLLDNSAFGADDFRYSYTSRAYAFEFTIKDLYIEQGNWNEINMGHGIALGSGENEKVYLKKKGLNNNLVLADKTEGKLYYKVKDPEVIRSMVIFLLFFQSRSIMERNLNSNKKIANAGDFGKAVVYKNFDLSSPISV